MMLTISFGSMMSALNSTSLACSGLIRCRSTRNIRSTSLKSFSLKKSEFFKKFVESDASFTIVTVSASCFLSAHCEKWNLPKFLARRVREDMTISAFGPVPLSHSLSWRKKLSIVIACSFPFLHLLLKLPYLVPQARGLLELLGLYRLFHLHL